MARRRWGTLAAAAVLLGGIGIVARSHNGYEVKFVMPSAAQLAKGSPVWIDGAEAGSVSNLEVKDNQAIVTARIDGDHAPLHAGTGTRVDWVSAVGERILTVEPGPQKNAELPSGALVKGESHQAEVDQVLAALDAPTRAKLTSLITELNQTVGGQEQPISQTIAQAGPVVQALGTVLAAVGQDGPAVRSLVTQLSQMTAITSQHQGDVARTVQNLTSLSQQVATQQQAISDTLAQLPSVLQTANTTLGKVPAASKNTVTLLDDLRPATAKLPSVSARLAPVLTDLQPTIADLKPMLASTSQLLTETPGLLDTTHSVLPQTGTLLAALQPAVSFLRPYTPEGVGGLANWGQAFAPYDGRGHIWAGLLAPGTNALNESVVRPAGARDDFEPAPGEPVGQPWTDATGSEIR